MFYNSRSTMIDLGTGTGILSFLFIDKTKFSGKTYAIDFNEQAVKCCELNKQILNLQDKVNTF
jgi:methylase of polypeptide subunit release factors